MKKSEKVLLNFEAKAQKIIHKYSLLPHTQPEKYSYFRLSGFFGHFNNSFRKLDEELNKESLGILSHFINNDEVDFVSLAERLYQQKNKAKMDFIQRQQSMYLYN